MLPLFEGQNEIRRRTIFLPTLVSLCASFLLALAVLIAPGTLCASDGPGGWLHPDPDHLDAGRFAQVVTALDLADDVELAGIQQPLLDSWAWQHSLLRARVASVLVMSSPEYIVLR